MSDRLENAIWNGYPLERDPAIGELAVIPFHDRWQPGFWQLLITLGSLDTPRPLTNGAQVAMEVRQFMASRRSWHTVL